LQFKVKAGASVYIQLGTEYSSGSPLPPIDLTLDISAVPGQPNDDFVNALDVGALPFTAQLDNTGLTREVGEPYCRSISSGTAWYRFTATDSSRFVLKSDAAGPGTTLAAYTGSSLATLSQLGCSSDFHPTVIGSVQAGTTVYVQAGGIRIGEPFTLQLLPLVAPPNDDLANATDITSLPFDDHPPVLGATTETDEVASCGLSYSRTVWYRYTATTALTLRLEGDYASFAQYIVRGDGPPGPSSEVLCGEGNQFPLQAGDTLFIQAAGYSEHVDLHLEAVHPPDNDRWQDAVAIGSLPFSDQRQTEGAGLQYGEALPFTCNGMATTVWYTFTANDDAVLSIDTEGSDFDIVLAAYTERNGAPDQFLGCSDTFFPTDPEHMRVRVTKDETVFIQVGGYMGFTGGLAFHALNAEVPPNDAFLNATVITQLPFIDALNTSLATAELGEAFPCWEIATDTVWYSYTAATPTTLAVDTHGSDHWTMLAAYVFDSLGYPPRPRDAVACDGPAYLGYPPPTAVENEGVIVFALDAGQTAYIQAANAGHGGDRLSLRVTEPERPANDNVQAAREVTELPLTDDANTIGATEEDDEPACGRTPQYTTWYAYTAPRDLVLSVTTDGSDFDAALSAFLSTGEPSLPAVDDRIKCDSVGTTSRMRLSLHAGEHILIQVNGRGQLNLNMAIEREGLLPSLEIVTLSPIALERELLRLRDALHDNFEPSVYDSNGLSTFDLCTIAYALRVGAGDIDGANRLNSNGDNLPCGWDDFIPAGELAPVDFNAINLDADQLSEHADGYTDGVIVVAFTLDDGPIEFAASDGTWYRGPSSPESGNYVCDTAQDDADCTPVGEFSFGRDGIVIASLSGPLANRGDVGVEVALTDTDVIVAKTIRSVGDPVGFGVTRVVEPRIETGGEMRCGLPPYALRSGSIPEELLARAGAFDASLLVAQIVDSDGTPLSNIPLAWSEEGGFGETSLVRGFSSELDVDSATLIGGANDFCAGATRGQTQVQVTVSGAANAACIREFDGSNSLGGEVCYGRAVPVLSTTLDVSVVGPPASMDITADPAAIPCDGIHSATIAAQLLDSDGNQAVQGREVRFDAGSLGTTTPALASTDASGVASTELIPAAQGQASVVVTADGPSGVSGSVTVDCLAPTATPTFTPSSTATPTAVATATATPTPVQADCVPFGRKLRLLLAITKRLGNASGDRRYDARYDLNGDNVIDLDDLGIAADLHACRNGESRYARK
jgi:hypothetical protein